MESGLYKDTVSNKYIIYNSLFLNLPFRDIYHTGTLLPLFELSCKKGFERNQSPVDIIEQFLADTFPGATGTSKYDILFKFIQYVERQIVLFDSVEDAAFESINDVTGKGSLSHLFSRVKSDGLETALLKKINEFGLRIVLTAHPTQFYPGQVLAIITDLEEAIRENNLKNINLLLQQLGKTPFINKEKPSPLDEAFNLIWYLENIFYKAIPEVVRRLIDFTGNNVNDFSNSEIIRIGFWPGGDRDGNPFVTHDITLQVADRLKETALKCYYRDIRILRRRLTFKNLEDQILSIEKKIFNAVYGEKSHGYQNIEALWADLLNARKTLIEEHGSLFLDILDFFILKTKIFGFHLAQIDIRQDSRKHRELINTLLSGHQKKDIQKDQSKSEYLNQLADLNLTISKDLVEDPFHREMISTIESIKTIQLKNGKSACERYIISNAMYASDIMCVFALAKNIFNEKHLPLDIIPLFESIEFLGTAPESMDLLYSNPVYKAHLKSRNNVQTIMLGFSDGTKDGGYLQANFSIFQAKEALTAVSRKHGIKVIFFDGRGGPPARGGGNTHDFYASMGPDIENKEIQLTVQGQTISANFGKVVSCKYNIEQLLTAGIENDLYAGRYRALDTSERALLKELAGKSYEAYAELKAHPAFVPYLNRATPLRFFGKTNIGSRPVKRTGGADFQFEDLRAIPFVGSWAQIKQNVPGFYGFGRAIHSMEESGKMENIKGLYKNSLFFRALVGNSMQSLAKAFFPATAYQSKDSEFGPFWNLIYEEYTRTIKALLSISGQEELLADNTLSRESIKLREQIVMPLITIQQFAIQKLLQDGEQPDDATNKMLQQLVLRCMYGIINAARNAA